MVFLSKSSCSVTLAPQRGAIVTSIKVGDHELLYLDQATFDDPQKNVRGGIPVLFPLCGPLLEPSYSWEGQSYTLKQHGFARNIAWKELEVSSDRAIFELSNSASTEALYPFAFTYSLEFVVLEDGLRIEQTIKNTGEHLMPVQFGFHPYFQASNKDNLSFSLPVRTYSDNKSTAKGNFSGFDFSRDEIDWAFPNPSERKASFVDLSTNFCIELSYGKAYQELVFWTLKDKPFICLEPWSSARLHFPDGPDVHRLGPGEILKSFIQIRGFDRLS